MNDDGRQAFTNSVWIYTGTRLASPRHIFSIKTKMKERLCARLCKFNFKLLKLAPHKKPLQFPEAVCT
ncbi:MAG: hypothetical protein DI595_15070 [Agrobacterium fabrum]|uniref:Uncharacterized protein n=1 Tax=Agrobacterium fabrum TaxID=1176649 RepID=A0A2W5F4L2_9HYPH|nr:MAG: hypothetical protein DI595_15070 [Agrobacterium fabrum]